MFSDWLLGNGTNKPHFSALTSKVRHYSAVSVQL